MGTVDSYNSRLDETRSEKNKSRTISKGYYFFIDGKEYKGYIIYNSDDSWSNFDKGETRTESITYLPIFPYINKPSMLVELDKMGEFAIIYHIVAPVGYVLLFILMIKTVKKQRKKDTKWQRIDKSKSTVPIFCYRVKSKKDMIQYN